MKLIVKIKKDFGSFVLRADFETQNGVMGILGASGCGKSMTLQCIAGVMTPDEGYIELNGKVFFDSKKKINLKPQERHVGLLFQNYALFPNMTVYQNLMLGIKPYEKDAKKRQQAVEEAMERFGLSDLRNHKPYQLSGGQKQRTALVRILLSKPQILMLDEPFSALDDFLRWNLELELVDILQEFSGITLFVSHNRDEIYRICDTVCVMQNGSCSPVISVRELFEIPKTMAAANLSGCKNFCRVRAVGEHAVEAIDWGLIFEVSQKIPQKLSVAGIRSHYFHLLEEGEGEGMQNVFSCIIEKNIDNLFSVILVVNPETAASKQRIRLELSDDAQRDKYLALQPGERIFVQVDPQDIMLLEDIEV